MNTVQFSWKHVMALVLCLAVFICGQAGRAEPETSFTEVTSGLWEDMKDAAGSATEKVRKTVEEKINDANYTFGEVQDWTLEKVREILETFASYRPIIKEAGFEVGEIAVEVGLIPKLVVTFDKLQNIDETKQRKLLEKHREDRVLTFMLNSLFKVYSLQLDTYDIKKTRLYLTIPPKTLIILSTVPSEDKIKEEPEKGNDSSLY